MQSQFYYLCEFWNDLVTIYPGAKIGVSDLFEDCFGEGQPMPAIDGLTAETFQKLETIQGFAVNRTIWCFFLIISSITMDFSYPTLSIALNNWSVCIWIPYLCPTGKHHIVIAFLFIIFIFGRLWWKYRLAIVASWTRFYDWSLCLCIYVRKSQQSINDSGYGGQDRFFRIVQVVHTFCMPSINC